MHKTTDFPVLPETVDSTGAGGLRWQRTQRDERAEDRASRATSGEGEGEECGGVRRQRRRREAWNRDDRAGKGGRVKKENMVSSAGLEAQLW